jgi:hypothetical protein
MAHPEAETLSFVMVGANCDLHAGRKALHRIPEQSITTCIPKKLTLATQMVKVDRQTSLLEDTASASLADVLKRYILPSKNANAPSSGQSRVSHRRRPSQS